MTKNILNGFIDIEGDNDEKYSIKDGYKRNLVNISHIIRFEKEEKKENSKILVHLVDGTTLQANFKTYESLRTLLELK